MDWRKVKLKYAERRNINLEMCRGEKSINVNFEMCWI